ncbi:class I SAM-dependent methyltransferase [Paenibacillus allorhizosphaerae]|uniref:Methyltransferase domain-containing protein n=1 Tax=Paenibacillus allorhizosphaerae TaxID=2849866 RepID=A0ABN7TKN3_9BACL|nr:class I SAM-dependent methyltransferase [Paenibacillus allorhizosphaerae]CAG7644294.1 hypothetical protein PAECIP111802_03219 [Paenibacillus allorhizosphaerae]
MEDLSIHKIINRAYDFVEEQQKLLDDGAITEEQWFETHNRFCTAHYLAADNPRGQSGHSGDERHYFQTHAMLLQAIHKNGTFIDVGCANGYLLESLDRWTKSLGFYELEWYGLDISKGLIELAKQRLPEWTGRFFVGNAFTWVPDVPKFDFVCVKELSYVPKKRRRAFLEHVLQHYVAPGGRLILGPNSERQEARELENELSAWGYEPSGNAERTHPKHKMLTRRLLWFDKP